MFIISLIKTIPLVFEYVRLTLLCTFCFCLSKQLYWESVWAQFWGGSPLTSSCSGETAGQALPSHTRWQHVEVHNYAEVKRGTKIMTISPLKSVTSDHMIYRQNKSRKVTFLHGCNRFWREESTWRQDGRGKHLQLTACWLVFFHNRDFSPLPIF